MNKPCQNQYSSSKNTDELGRKIVMCKKTRESCLAQRFCTELKRYIVSEQAEKYCKYFK